MEVDGRRTPEGELGPVLATGRDATVHALGDDRVLRRLPSPERDLRAEAEVMEHVRALGYPVPQVFRVGPGEMVLERVEGPTMLQAIETKVWHVDRHARTLAETEKVEIRTYEIIYQILEDIQAAMVGMLKPEFEEVVTGDAEVRQVFQVPRVGAVAGCYVRNGTITRGSKVRFIREGVVIWTGSIATLRRFKDDVREVQTGFECGIGLSDFKDLKSGDIIETYEEREIPRT